MATQLEAIPEETIAPAPATTPVRVTADPPKTKPATEKNPGRVAVGKRLAQYNRLARETKKKAEAAKQDSTSATQSSASQSGNTNTESSSSSGTIVTILGIGGLIVSALGVYYQREAIMQRLKPAPPVPAPVPAPAPAPEPAAPAPSRIPVKRGIRGME